VTVYCELITTDAKGMKEQMKKVRVKINVESSKRPSKAQEMFAGVITQAKGLHQVKEGHQRDESTSVSSGEANILCHVILICIM